MEIAGYSADNVAFGQCGTLLQQINRDTMKFAMKCSAARIDGKWVEVFEDTVTDQGKKSKKGLVTLYKSADGTFSSGIEDWPQSALETVFENGELKKEYSFDEVRANSRK